MEKGFTELKKLIIKNQRANDARFGYLEKIIVFNQSKNDKRFDRLEKQIKENSVASAAYTDKSVESLAAITSRGFQRMDEKFDILTEEIRLIKDDVHDLRVTTRLLVGTDADHEKRITALEARAA